MTRYLRTLVLPLLTLFFAAACADSPTEPAADAGPDLRSARSEMAPEAGSTIADIVVGLATAEEDAEFTVLLAALQAADLVGAVSGDGPLTVFAPTDAAFGRILEQYGITAEQLLSNTPLLQKVLLYHVVPGALRSGDVLGASELRTLQGGFIFPTSNDDGAFILDTEDDSEDAQLQAPDLIDIIASNGVIHVIDEVLVPGNDGRPEQDDDDGDDDGEDDGDEPTIADIVLKFAKDEENPEFTILLGALQATGLVEAVDGADPLTVFAPTDAAFGRLLELYGLTPDDLVANKALLRKVVLYHVVPGALRSGDVLGAGELQTLQGGFIFPTSNEEGAFIVDTEDDTEDAQLQAPDLIDVIAANGVIHVIDEVLVPGNDTPGGSTGEYAGGER